jgi:hypothetical protein
MIIQYNNNLFLFFKSFGTFPILWCLAFSYNYSELGIWVLLLLLLLLLFYFNVFFSFHSCAII